jgi:hypothetical protein
MNILKYVSVIMIFCLLFSFHLLEFKIFSQIEGVTELNNLVGSCLRPKGEVPGPGVRQLL